MSAVIAQPVLSKSAMHISPYNAIAVTYAYCCFGMKVCLCIKCVTFVHNRMLPVTKILEKELSTLYSKISNEAVQL